MNMIQNKCVCRTCCSCCGIAVTIQPISHKLISSIVFCLSCVAQCCSNADTGSITAVSSSNRYVLLTRKSQANWNRQINRTTLSTQPTYHHISFADNHSKEPKNLKRAIKQADVSKRTQLIETPDQTVAASSPEQQLPHTCKAPAMPAPLSLESYGARSVKLRTR
jgi:hypothetical protein